MIIVGAKGHAKQVLQILQHNKSPIDLYFYDDVSNDLPILLYGQFPILRHEKAAGEVLKTSTVFCLGVGGPQIRKMLTEKLEVIGGQLTSVVSPTAQIGSFGVNIMTGAHIMYDVFIGNDVTISKGTLINQSAAIHHDVTIGQYTEIAPGAQILGRAQIGDLVFIGAGAIVLPGVTVGSGAVIGAGAVVNRNVEPLARMAGVPARDMKPKL